MPSKRIYKEVKCANPACGRKYAPHDKRQRYCEPQCRINSNNDKTQLLNNGRYQREKNVRAIDKALELLSTSGFYKNEKIQSNVLDEFHVDPMLGSIVQNASTHSPIFWFHTYGLELVDERKGLYTIHSRTL